MLFVFFPLMILTGLAMSPGGDALLPFLPDLLGGRQTARTIHFLVMALLVAFFVIHIVMILAAGPINELRSIITGWYRTDPPAENVRPQPNATPSRAPDHDKLQDQPPRLHHLGRRRRLRPDARPAATSSTILSNPDNGLRNFFEGANNLTYRVQRLLGGGYTLAQEFTEADIRQPQRPNGVTAPDDAVYKGLLSGDFADWRLKVTGLVEKPLSLTPRPADGDAEPHADHPP